MTGYQIRDIFDNAKTIPAIKAKIQEFTDLNELSFEALQVKTEDEIEK